jgi:hypothetical protein
MIEPRLSKAEPKPGLSGQAGPAHHYRPYGIKDKAIIAFILHHRMVILARFLR